MESIEVVIRAGGDELMKIPFTAGDRAAQTERSLRLISWIVGGVTREETRKRATRPDRAVRPDGDDNANPES